VVLLIRRKLREIATPPVGRLAMTVQLESSMVEVYYTPHKEREG
jgi:hypothetical protein